MSVKNQSWRDRSSTSSSTKSHSHPLEKSLGTSQLEWRLPPATSPPRTTSTLNKRRERQEAKAKLDLWTQQLLEAHQVDRPRCTPLQLIQEKNLTAIEDRHPNSQIRGLTRCHRCIKIILQGRKISERGDTNNSAMREFHHRTSTEPVADPTNVQYKLDPVERTLTVTSPQTHHGTIVYSREFLHHLRTHAYPRQHRLDDATIDWLTDLENDLELLQ